MPSGVKKNNDIMLAKPILKWAGGKTQLLKNLSEKVPLQYGKYIEPFFGGGALFFNLKPKNAVIADSNPELINMYRQVADALEMVIFYLEKYENTSEMFYSVREQEWTSLPEAEAAARTIFLNKTCFNGLYRVNKKGKFNVPFGNYKNPKICDVDALTAASRLLNMATIVCGDYKQILLEHAEPDDFIFLDPPYLPISENADFKRYTKEQFHENDHNDLATEVERLRKLGCFTLLTNSNHPLVHQLFSAYPIEIIATKRYISCSGNNRKGEDVIVTVPPISYNKSSVLDKRVELYPPTRFMGSKRKLLVEIWRVASRFHFDSVLDLFSGSGVVGYMFKSQGKEVISNDYMSMSAVFSKAMIENSYVTLPIEQAEILLIDHGENDHFVENKFRGLYFKDDENILIDILRSNIWKMEDSYKQAIAMTALIRACTKKRPRGVFTYTGERYNDGRKDLQKSLSQQFLESVELVNKAVFSNNKTNRSSHGDALDLNIEKVDLVYIDPPYYSPLSDNEYVRRYHFVEGLARDWKGVEIQEHTQTKKFKSYPTPFSSRNGAENALERLFEKFSDSILIISYSSNSLPTKVEILKMLSKYKEHVEVLPIDYTYSFGNQKDIKSNRNKVQEYLFVAY